jgi:hypothetical protein
MRDFKMNKAILIREKLGEIVEIDLDISPQKNEIFKILGGRQTFIGQWPDIDVVIMKPEDGKVKNENTLPPPVRWGGSIWKNITRANG